MGKYGKKNEVKINPLAYNICVLGESKIGKTTIIKEVCEKLAGEDGYLFLEMYHEDGADAIQGIVYEDVPDWDTFEDIVEDIVDNRTTDYKDLKVVVIDTYDQFVQLAEQESIDLWNRENPDKRVTSINAAWGGYMKGQDKAVDLMFEKLWELKSVGVTFIVIGHVKTKDVTDVASGDSYQTLTSDLTQRYFNALKNKLHFLGLAYIDREIIKEKSGKKNAVTKKDEYVSKVVGETRKIKFRDDNYAVDSGSRFADIVDEIPFGADEFIEALTNAIKSEQSKSKKSYDTTKKEQEKAESEKMKAVAKQNEDTKKEKELQAVIAQITDFLKENRSDMKKIKPILEKSKELNYANPTQITDIKDANEVLKLITQ